MGEPAALPAFQERDRQMIVFGGAGWRRDAYTRHLPSLQNACRCLQIERVIDIGVPTGVRPTLPIPFVETGVLPAREASALMLKSVGGFFTYPVLHIGKSTIFAAYCAHGMAPVTIAANAILGDEGLQPEKHFLTQFAGKARLENVGAEIAENAQAWYHQHRLAVHAQQIAHSLGHDV